MKIELTALEARVIGSLIEKQITTPDQYPLSLNALTNACNQKSNRDPAMNLDDAAVQQVLDSLQRKHHVIERSGFGSRVSKFQHVFCNTEHGSLRLSAQELALLCELLLRGPQTPGELRSRASRLAGFTDVTQVEAVLEALVARPDGPLVQRLLREPGRRDARYAQLFTGAISEAAAAAAPMRSGATGAAPQEPLEQLEFKLAHLERGFQELSDVVARQQQDIERLTQHTLALGQAMRAAQGAAEDAATQVEVPPHY